MEESVSECSLRSSEDGDDVSVCSLFEMPDKHEDDDWSLVRMFFKGVSFSTDGDLDYRTSGIGVSLESPPGYVFFHVQKKMDFFVDEIVAEHLALMDGLLAALKNDCHKVIAFTDSDKVYRMITKTDTVEDQLLIALQERIQEIANKFESFVLRQAPRSELKSTLQLARYATGAFRDLLECSICGEETRLSQMIEMHCYHNLCFDCMRVYIESQPWNLRDKRPKERCTNYFSNGIGSYVLPFPSLDSFKGELLNFWAIYCQFPDCSTLIYDHHCSRPRQPPLIQSSMYCVECPDFCRLVCTRCRVTCHPSMKCDEYQNLPSEERNSGDIASNQLVQVSEWRRCIQCEQLRDPSEGCERCAREFCFCCRDKYINGIQTCLCRTEKHGTDRWR